MKKILFLTVMLVLAATASAQVLNLNNQAQADLGKLVKTYTTYLEASSDTTGYITIPNVNPLLCSELVVVSIASDSVQATLYFIGNNSKLAVSPTVYTDSITTLGGGSVAWTAALPKVKVTVLKGPGVNQLAGCDRFKIGTVFLNDEVMGTTAGRTLKHYIFYKTR